MSLKNFGGVLDYAIAMEKQDSGFIQQAMNNPDMQDCSELLQALAKENLKNAKNLARARQENISEMILEPVQGLEEKSYQLSQPDAAGISRPEIMQLLQQMEERAQRFYTDAAEKIRPVSDVFSTFQKLTKKRKARIEKLSPVLGN